MFTDPSPARVRFHEIRRRPTRRAVAPTICPMARTLTESGKPDPARPRGARRRCSRHARPTPLPSPSMPAVQRLFVALDLPDGIRATLAATPIDRATWRPIPEANLHVTLAFLGNRPPTDVDLIAPIIEAEHDAPPTRARQHPQLRARPRRHHHGAARPPERASRQPSRHASVSPRARPFHPRVTRPPRSAPSTAPARPSRSSPAPSPARSSDPSTRPARRMTHAVRRSFIALGSLIVVQGSS